jgi:hypothetical protein
MKNDTFLLAWNTVATQEFPCDISMYMCIINPIGSSPLFFLHCTLDPFL